MARVKATGVLNGYLPYKQWAEIVLKGYCPSGCVDLLLDYTCLDTSIDSIPIGAWVEFEWTSVPAAEGIDGVLESIKILPPKEASE